MQERTMLRLTAIGLLAATAVSTVHAAHPQDLRVAGIASAGRRQVAHIESRAGEQYTVRVGDEFAGGKVVAILPEAVRIEWGGRTWRLPLQGQSLYDGARVTPEQRAEVRYIDRRTADALARLRAEVGDDEKRLASRFAEVLTLPPSALVVGMDGQPVASTADVIDQLRMRIDAGTRSSLTLDGGDLPMVVLMP
jgi:hypothetical protein